MENTKISWCHHSLNFWVGCEAVSEGCDHCYAKTLEERWGRDFATLRRTAPATWKQAYKWEKQAAASGEPTRVFTCSMSDFFHNDADQWRVEAWHIIKNTPHLTWLILTKRHGRIASHLPPDWGDGYPNVWLGVSVENQEWADRRIPVLLKTPARVRFLSCEPLLGPVDLSRWLDNISDVPQDPAYPFPVPESGRWHRINDFEQDLHWVIVGGESGPGYRPMPHDWARDLRDQCQEAGVALWAKQASGYRSELPLPPDLQVRQLPQTGGR